MGLGGYPGWAWVFFSLLITVFFFCILLCVWFFFLKIIFQYLIYWELNDFFIFGAFGQRLTSTFFFYLFFFHLIIWHYFLSWFSWFSLIFFLLGYLNLITWPISLVGWPEQTCVFFFCLWLLFFYPSFLLIIFFQFHHSTFD